MVDGAAEAVSHTSQRGLSQMLYKRSNYTREVNVAQCGVPISLGNLKHKLNGHLLQKNPRSGTAGGEIWKESLRC